jgi:hypothetical protein
MARPCLPTPASRACLTIRHELPGNNQFIFRRRRIISASAENRGNSCQRKHSAPGTRLGQSCVSQTSQLKTRIVSVARIRLNPWKTVRPFKGIICDDISEFESYMPSQPVRSRGMALCGARGAAGDATGFVAENPIRHEQCVGVDRQPASPQSDQGSEERVEVSRDTGRRSGSSRQLTSCGISW